MCSKASHARVQVGGLVLGGSALFRTNGLTQFGARHLVSRVGGDPFSNMGETAEALQLPIALWCADLVNMQPVLVVKTVLVLQIHKCPMDRSRLPWGR